MSTVRRAVAELIKSALGETSSRTIVATSIDELRHSSGSKDDELCPAVVLVDEDDCASNSDTAAAAETLADYAGCVVPVVLGHRGATEACAAVLGDPFVCAKPVSMPLAVVFARGEEEVKAQGSSCWLGAPEPLPESLFPAAPYVVVREQPGSDDFACAFAAWAAKRGADGRPRLVVLGSASAQCSGGDAVVRVPESALSLAQTRTAVQQAACYVVLGQRAGAGAAFDTCCALAAAESGTPVVCLPGSSTAALNDGAAAPVVVAQDGDLLSAVGRVLDGEDADARRARMDAALALVRAHHSSGAQQQAVALVRERVHAIEAKLRFARCAAGWYDFPALRDKTHHGAQRRRCLGVDRLMLDDFARVLRADIAYLDSVGAALYGARQVREASELLLGGVWANPHSDASAADGLARSSPAIRAAAAVRAARAETLEFLGTTPAEHTAVFTSGCTAALKLVGECFAWSAGSVLCFHHDNHNSALGVREYALARGVPPSAVRSFDDDGALLDFVRAAVREHPEARHLVVMPLQGNFDGARHSTDVVDKLRELSAGSRGNGGVSVLVDAAAWVPHSPLDLRAVRADFVALSFYKIFGYPTGLGALVLRNDTALVALAHKTYFGGGTVSVSLQDTCHHVLRETLAERFEDGTLPFLSIAALHSGFSALRALGPSLDAVDRHTTRLTHHLARRLLALRHANGAQVCFLAGAAHRTYCASPAADDVSDERLEAYRRAQGPVVAFNVRRSDGAWVGPSTVGTLAALCGIQLRTGCACNPRACQRFLGLDDAAVLRNAEAGRVCWADDLDVVDGVPTGAVRASVGYYTRYEDVERLVAFIEDQFVDRHAPADAFPAAPRQALSDGARRAAESASRAPLTVAGIFFYPIKSCSGCSVRRWEIGDNGALKYDREWALVDASGRTLTQKQQPRLCFVQPAIDEDSRTLIIRAKDMPDVTIPLPREEEEEKSNRDGGGNDEAADQKQGQAMMCGVPRATKQTPSTAADLARVSAWFTQFLGIPCSFVQASSSSAYKSTSKNAGDRAGVRGSFLNSASFLVCSEASFDDLHARIAADERDGVDMQSFRPNILVRGNSEPYVEDRWRAVQVGPHILTSVRLCDRCVLTCVDKRTAHICREPLHTLAKYRHMNAYADGPVKHSGLMFGHLMDRVASSTGRPWTLEVGARVVVLDEFPPEAITPIKKQQQQKQQQQQEGGDARVFDELAKKAPQA